MSDDWMNADWYNSIASKVPSDTIGYSALFTDLRIEEGRGILHFGCHQGATTKAMAQRGADVVGIDKSYNSITKAEDKYPDLTFRHVPTYAPIPEDLYENKRFDAVAMPFVTPTIDDRREIDYAFGKCYEALKLGGRIGMLGLHPNSFKDQYSFVNYDHDSPQHSYGGHPFQNTIRTEEGETVTFTGYYWRPHELERALRRQGFENVRTREVTTDELGIGEAVANAAEDVEQTIGLEDELEAPLYKLIQGTRPNFEEGMFFMLS